MKRISLLFLFAACGGGVEPAAVEQQILYGRLEQAAELLQRMDPGHPSRPGLQAQIDGILAQRESARTECAAIRAGRDGRKLESLLAHLDEVAMGFDDEQAREIVLQEKSHMVDWDADRRAAKSYSVAQIRQVDRAEEEEQEPATLPRIRGLVQSIMVDVESASQSGEYARALALMDQLIGDLPGQASMLGVELLQARDDLWAQADEGAKRLLVAAENAERLHGARKAWDQVAGEYLRFPEGILGGQLSQRVEGWRSSLIDSPDGSQGAVAVQGSPKEESGQIPSTNIISQADSEQIKPEKPPAAPHASGGGLGGYSLTNTELLADPAEQALMGEKARVVGDLSRAAALLHTASLLTQDSESRRYRRRAMECRWLAVLSQVWTLDQGPGGATRGIYRQLKALGSQGVLQELEDLGDNPEARLGIMLACLNNGAPKFNDLGLGILKNQHEGGLLTQEHTDLLVALALGEQVPDGGYLLVADSFLSTVEHEEELIGRELELVLRQLSNRRGAKRDEAWEEVSRLADQYRFAELRLEATLDKFLALHTKRMLKRGEFKRLQQLAVRRKNLEVTRKAALALIFDEQEYFYPIPANRRAEYNLVQRRVDELVAEVRTIWEEPFTVSLGGDFHEELVDLHWVLAKLDVPNSQWELPSWLFLIQPDAALLSLRNFAPTQTVQKEIRISGLVEAYNERLWGLEEEVCRPMESEQVRVTNRYRRLLGRVSLAWDLRLQAATIVHGQYMSRTGIFSHFEEGVEGRRTPFDRMVEQSYNAGLGENIHAGAGDPEGAHYGWAHSSGHHRALLSGQATEMATSVVGRYWTQNFGIGRDSRKGMK